MSEDWYVRRGDEQWGPLDLKQLHALRSSIQFQGNEWIWRSGWPHWKLVRDIEQELGTAPPLLPAQKAQILYAHMAILGLDRTTLNSNQFVELLTDFVGALDGSSVQADESRFADAIERASDLIFALESACIGIDGIRTRPVGSAEAHREIWRHRDLERAFREGPQSKEACPLSRAELSDLAAMYLAQDLRSPLFEFVLVDALMATEVYHFGEELKENPSRFTDRNAWSVLLKSQIESREYADAKGEMDRLNRLRFWRVARRRIAWLAALYIPALSFLYWAFFKSDDVMKLLASGLVAGMAVVSLARWAWRKVHFSLFGSVKNEFEKALILHQKMAFAYSELKVGPGASPVRVREVLSKLADQGAYWDPMVYTLLDSAISRGHGSWRFRMGNI